MNRRRQLFLLAFLCATAALAHAADPDQTARSITIYRDDYGVPHIYGPTDAACAFGFMYAPAEDNFWQRRLYRSAAKRGEPLYFQDCSSCHGEKLAGSESAPPLAGSDFITDWDGRTAGDLFKKIRRTMPQDDPGRLSPGQSADLLAYILSVNKFPNGKAELPQQSEMLQQVRIEASKPDPKEGGSSGHNRPGAIRM